MEFLFGKTISELHIGDTAYIEKTFTHEDVVAFGNVCLDLNPMHFDEAFALKSIFKKRVVHGILTAGLISAVIGMKLPGPGSIYLSQELVFMKPVFIEDRIRADVIIKEIIKEKNTCLIDTICTNQCGDVVLKGMATVMPPLKTLRQ